jgi:large subunit ribosomal protein L30
MPGRLRVTQIKSTISHIARNRATVRALGLKRIGHTVDVADNPATRGMVRQVRFLVSVEEVSDAGPAKGDAAARAATRPSKDRAATSPSEDRAATSPSEDRAATSPSEDRGDAPASHRSEDSEDSEDSQEKA